MNKIKIRRTKLSDAQEHIDFSLFIYKNTYKNLMPQSVFDEIFKNRDKVIAKYNENWISKKNKLCLVAIDGNKIVGYLSGFLSSRQNYFVQKGYAELGALYVHPDYQRQRIGKKLMDKFVAWLKSNGCSKFVVGVLEDNSIARNAYKKWGGRLSKYTSEYVKQDIGYKELFYIYKI